MPAVAEQPNFLNAVLGRLAKLPDGERMKVERDAMAATVDKVWVPNAGPQAQAYFSKADVLLYGGQAGGGKSQLLIGWSVNEADAGIVFRRELSQADGLERDGKQIIGSRGRYNGQDHEWTWASGKTLKLGGMKVADSWIDHAGRERDFIGFDEAGEFLEVQVASIAAWLRAAPGKRTRMILASNPPRTSEGLWLIDWFGPWLDEHHPLYPTAPGKLRWAVYVKNRMVWVDGPGEHQVDGESYIAKSYTFIPASLEDNPDRNTDEYRAQLQSLPEPLRSQLLYGDFKAGLRDGANQVVPTAWIRAAQARWKPKPPEGIPMCAIAADCTGGGDDPLVIGWRHDSWFSDLVETPGEDVPLEKIGAFTAGQIISHRRDDADITLDMGGGYGGPGYEWLHANGLKAYAYKGAEKTPRRTLDKKLGFTNKRSAALWKLREALDPGQPGGSTIALPPNTRMAADLTAPTFEVTQHGIKVESKEDVCARLGRSTDFGDVIIMLWWQGATLANSALKWAKGSADSEQGSIPGRRGGQMPQVKTGRLYSRKGA